MGLNSHTDVLGQLGSRIRFGTLKAYVVIKFEFIFLVLSSTITEVIYMS